MALQEFDFVFNVTCLTDDKGVCPPTGAVLLEFETKIPDIITQLSQPTDPDRLILKGLKLYKGPEPEPYSRPIFVGWARGKIFNQAQIVEMSEGGAGFNLFLKKVFFELESEGVEWAAWTIVPLPDGTFNNFEFTPMGGSGRG